MLALFTLGFGYLALMAESLSVNHFAVQGRGVPYWVDNGANRALSRALIAISFLALASIAAFMLWKRKQAEDSERRSRMIAESINAITLQFLESGTSAAMAQALVDQALRLTGAERGYVIDLDEDGAGRLLARSRTEPPAAESASESWTDSLSEWAMEADNPFLAPVTAGRTVLVNDPNGVASSPPPCISGQIPIRNYLGVPIKPNGHALGMIGLLNRPGAFTPQEVELLAALAGAAAVVFRTARVEKEQARVEERMRQATKMEAIGRLAGGIAHDFNNLLTVVMGYSERGQAEAAGPVAGYFEEIEKAASRGSDLAQQLLAFSRRQRQEMRIMDMNALLQEMHGMLDRLIGDDIVIESRLAERVWPIRVDPTQFQQVVVNLVVNARDAIPDGGRLLLATQNLVLDQAFAQAHAGFVPGAYVVLSVSDNGRGMTADIRDRVFEPFFTTKETGKGTGLGLSTCYGIVKQSGGYIWIDSTPNEGTTVTVYLPRTAGKPAALEKRTPPPQSPRGTETILLVEDEHVVRRLAAEVLTAHGYSVIEASDGEEALAVIWAHTGRPIDLLITDVHMPRMGGKELLNRLGGTESGLRGVLFITGHADSPIDGGGGLRVDVLQKPFKPTGLAGKVREILDSASPGHAPLSLAPARADLS